MPGDTRAMIPGFGFAPEASLEVVAGGDELGVGILEPGAREVGGQGTTDDHGHGEEGDGDGDDPPGAAGQQGGER